MKSIKNTLVGLTAALLLTACSNNQNNLEPKATTIATQASNSIASDASEEEIQKQQEYAERIKKRNKRNKRKNVTKTKIDLKKFCFKNSNSIHYRSNERCK